MERCGAKTRGGGICQNTAGKRTDHVGQGKCWLHGGATPVKHGRYSLINRPRIKELMEQFEQDENPLDLHPEIIMLRALILDYIERYDEQTEGLIAWHASFAPGFQQSFAPWQAEMDRWRSHWEQWLEEMAMYREHVERVQAHYRGGWPEPPEVPDLMDPPPPPYPPDFAGKPRQVVDILDVGRFIGQIGALIERIQKQKQEGSITLATLHQVLQQFGLELYQGAMEEIPDESVRSAVLENVEARWAGIRLPSNFTASQPGG